MRRGRPLLDFATKSSILHWAEFPSFHFLAATHTIHPFHLRRGKKTSNFSRKAAATQTKRRPHLRRCRFYAARSPHATLCKIKAILARGEPLCGTVGQLFIFLYNILLFCRALPDFICFLCSRLKTRKRYSFESIDYFLSFPLALRR